jgi:hypothetical protein
VVDRALAQTTLAWAGGAFLKAGVRLWLLQVLPLESFLVAITLFTWTVNAALLVGSFRWPLRALAADR